MTTKTYNSQTSQRLLQVLDWIKQNPEHWNQKVWHCGTSHCFAGVAQLMMHGYDPTAEVTRDVKQSTASQEAAQWLRITTEEAEDLFYGGNKLHHLETMVERLCEQYG